MNGYEYAFTKMLIKEFWHLPNAPQPFCEAVDWQPILAELDRRVKEKEASARKAVAQVAPPPVALDDDTLGQFGL